MHAENLRHLRAEVLDVFALLADHDTGSRRVDRDVRLFRRALDGDTADRCILELALDEDAQLVIALHVLRKRARIGIPLGRPVLDDTEAYTGWMYFLTHIPYLSPT